YSRKNRPPLPSPLLPRRGYLFSAGSAAASAAPVGALAERLPGATEGLARAPNPAPEAGALPALNTDLREPSPRSVDGTQPSSPTAAPLHAALLVAARRVPPRSVWGQARK